MTDKEKLDAIRAEIHRLVDVRGYDREMANDLFTFMDSLPNEPISDDLEDAASSFARKELIDKAIGWIKEINTHHHIMRYSDSCEPPLSELIEWFKNYMKEENINSK